MNVRVFVAFVCGFAVAVPTLLVARVVIMGELQYDVSSAAGWQSLASWVAAGSAAIAGACAGIALYFQHKSIEKQTAAIELETQSQRDDAEALKKRDAHSVGFKVTSREIVDFDLYEAEHLTRYKICGIVVSSPHGSLRNVTISVRSNREASERLFADLFNQTVDHKGEQWTNFNEMRGLMSAAIMGSFVPGEVVMFQLTTSQSIGWDLELEFWFVDQHSACWRLSSDNSGLVECDGTESVAIPGAHFTRSAARKSPTTV